MSHLMLILGYYTLSYGNTTEIEDLFQHQSDFDIKVLYKETLYTEFWVHLLNVPEYRSIAKKQLLLSLKCPQRIYAKVFFVFV